MVRSKILINASGYSMLFITYSYGVALDCNLIPILTLFFLIHFKNNSIKSINTYGCKGVYFTLIPPPPPCIDHFIFDSQSGYSGEEYTKVYAICFLDFLKLHILSVSQIK